PHGGLGLLWLAGLAMLSLGLLTSSIVYGNILRGLIVVGQYAFSYFLLSFVLVERDPPTLRLFLKSWVFSIVAINALGVAVFSWGFDFTQFSWVTENPEWRIVSGSGRLQTLLGDPNASASMIAITLPLLLYLWLTGSVRTLAVVGILPLLISAAIMTSSVNGLASNSFSILLFVVLAMRWRMLIGVLGGAAASIVWFGVWGTEYLPRAFQKRVLDAWESGGIEQAGTAQDRLVLFREAMDIIDRNPLIGVGADQFRLYTSSGLPVHDAYFLVWAEGGLIALIGWLVLLATPAVAAILAYQITRLRLPSVATVTVGGVFALIAVNNAHMYARFWLVPLHLGIALSIASWRQGTDAAAARKLPEGKA
ncbi:MAG: O-antigen ligase family protein, partial [Gammaproteobacteria bacterium]